MAALLLSGLTQFSAAQYSNWKYSGVMCLLTTPDGANLPATAIETNFPVLVRLNKEWFDFSQTKADGGDLRFSAEDKPLAYQIEQWDAAHGTASIWVRIPTIKGNTRQTIRLHWGKPDAASESSGTAVFNEANGFLGVWHMTEPLIDEIGTLVSTNVGTTSSLGIIGAARHFAGKQGIHCGEAITKLPNAASPHSTEVWYKSDTLNTDLVCWGQEGTPAGKVRMQLRSPAHIYVDSDGGSIHARSTLPKSEWIQVVHTYNGQIGQVYVNGQLDVAAPTATTMKILSPARMWIGGWYNNYNFIGDIDEVRISKVARSADWVKLQYENQKALQTLTGPLLQAGAVFAVSTPKINMLEGKSVTVRAKAGAAYKVYWVLKNGTQETIVAVDQFSFTFNAGRVTGDQTLSLQFKAVFANDVKTIEIPITIKDDIQDPIFSLKTPATWDGRETLEIIPQINNLPAMQAKGAADLKIDWKMSDIAVIQEIIPGKIILKRAQNSGKLTITATISNGGKPTTQSAIITVTEPKSDAWVTRIPTKDEKPVDNQFYARNDKNEGILYYNGTLEETADTVTLNVTADDKPYLSESLKIAANKSYAFTVKLKPGLIKYKVEFGTKSGTTSQLLNTVNNLVCGDAYIIQGQSNALATDTHESSPPETNEWIRSYGRPTENSQDSQANLWCNPVWKAAKTDKAELGYWGMELAKRLLESQKMPICIINGAVGGTRIDQHQRNDAAPADLTTIYGRALWRVQQAKLTHGIRGILWHQGESDQGSDCPSGDFDWKSYQNDFVQLSAGWKQDFPNIQHLYVFQIWPNACSMAGASGGGDKIREIQRTLPRLYSNLSVMSTLGVKPPGGCHYPLKGWTEFARLLQPLIERDFYNTKTQESISPPDLKKAYYLTTTKDTIALEFDQPIIWMDSMASQIYLDGINGNVESGLIKGNLLTLKLKTPSLAQKITYLKETAWNQDNLILGSNGIAALTFCDVIITEH